MCYALHLNQCKKHFNKNTFLASYGFPFQDGAIGSETCRRDLVDNIYNNLYMCIWMAC